VSHGYKDLIVWQQSKELAGLIYKATESFPRSELYGLSSQLRRAAVSVVSNLAEGQGRLTIGELRARATPSRVPRDARNLKLET
jgi:four helix bundle protein